eukprot:2940546-Amphidinium_carterae.1
MLFIALASQFASLGRATLHEIRPTSAPPRAGVDWSLVVQFHRDSTCNVRLRDLGVGVDHSC